MGLGDQISVLCELFSDLFIFKNFIEKNKHLPRDLI